MDMLHLKGHRMNRIKLAGYTFKFLIKNIPNYYRMMKRFDQQKFDQIVVGYCQGALNTINVTYTLIDKRSYIPENGLYISNHNSMYDSILSAIAVGQRHSYFIAGEYDESKHIPIIGNVFKMLNSIFVDRENIRSGMDAIIQGAKNLNNGLNLIIFAEGEITKYVITDDQQYVAEMHAGSFKPAVMSGRPIIPITIIGSDRIHNTRSMLSKVNSGHVVIIIGEPIPTTKQTSTVDLANQTRAVIVDTYQSNYKLLTASNNNQDK